MDFPRSMSFDIEFRNVSFRYEGSDHLAIDEVNIAIAPGEILLVTGPAGSGKTTLCSCINGLIPHYHEGKLTGDVLVRGYNTRRARIGGLASLVGLVFQDPESQLVTASVADEVAFGPENLGVPRQDILSRVEEALKVTRLTGYEDRVPHSLSGGEQQACVIAAIYAMHPDIYVMDEPLANLDPAGRTQILRLVVEVAKKRGKTLLLVEHALEESLPFADRVIVMNQGRVVRDGTVDQVLAGGDIPFVFTRPAIVRLADKLGFNPLPMTPEEFHRELISRVELHRIDSVEIQTQEIPSGKPIIELAGVTYSYDGSRRALDNVDLTVGEGEFIAILGRNGSGKTTLARHLIGLLHPDQGKVIVTGKDVSVTPTHFLAKEVGFCFQNPNHQLVAFNVRDEIIFGLKAHDVDPHEYESRVNESLEFVGMLDAREAEIFDLGKGQKQRLALASVLALRPRVLIVDEPTTGQDPYMSQEIFEILKRLNDAGTTVIIITHRIDYAAAYARRAIVMNSGQVTFDGPIRALLADLDLIQANSLDLPAATKLSLLLREYGIPPWLTTYEQLDAAVTALLEAANAR